MMQWSAIKAHNLEVVSSNLTPATMEYKLHTSTWCILDSAKCNKS